MLKNIRKRTEGFTIIEVLIVLAIAGLILLIVFLAVPALQRNSRNTQKKNDVSKALGAVNEWVSNNSGKVPTSADESSLNTAASLTQGVTIKVVDASTPANIPAAARDDIVIATQVQCSGSGVMTGALTAIDSSKYQAMVNASSARAYVALYVVEANGSNFTSQCQGS